MEVDVVQLQVVPVLLQHVLPHRPDVCEAGPVCWAQLPAVLQDGVAVTDRQTRTYEREYTYTRMHASNRLHAHTHAHARATYTLLGVKK